MKVNVSLQGVLVSYYAVSGNSQDGMDGYLVRLPITAKDDCFLIPKGALAFAGGEHFPPVVESVNRTPVEIRFDGYKIQAELVIDGDLFSVIACGGLPGGLVAFGKTLHEAMANFKEHCRTSTVANFGKENAN